MGLSTLVTFVAILSGVLAAPRGITMQDRVDAVEDILVSQSTNILAAINPCSVFTGVFGPQEDGEQTSAEWVRLVFHDFITADVKAGTG